MADTKIQRFKFTIPIVKATVKIVKDEDGNDIEERYIEGIASGTELDKHGDRMAPSAIESMAKSLKQHLINLNNEHDTSWSGELGDITKLTMTEKEELEIKARLNEMSSSNDLWYAITEQNKKLGLSIGGYVKDYEMVKEGKGDDAKWIRVYKEIDLDHIAVTSRPAYPKSWVSNIAKSVKDNDEKLLKKMMEEIQKPYPNEHACRLKDPGKYDTCRRKKRSHNGKQYSVIYCKKTGGKMEEQSYRYNKKIWSVSEARSHCKSHNGTFEAARSGKKSIKEDKKLLKKEEKSRRSQKDKRLRELARAIARSIQGLESDLLLELCYKGLMFLNEKQVLLLERSLPMKKKDVSLEAEKAKKKKKADAKKSKPEDKKDEDSATLENELSKEESKAEKEAKDKTKKTKADEEKSEKEKSSKEKGTKEKSEESTKAEEESEDDSGKGKEEDKAGDEDSEEEKSSKEKSKKKDDKESVLKAVTDLTSGLKKVLKSNEKLAERVKELESQPAGRKTSVEVDKTVGDEDEESKDAEALTKERDKKIAEVNKKYANDQSLFTRIQRIRVDYAKKLNK